MKKEKTVYDELMQKFVKYADRKAERIAQLTAASDKAADEIEEIQRKMRIG